ncbi:hypothetical protein AKO1_007138 [Acrasis kona]|uniref:Peptidase C2 calpain domain-containing protein n=1 Tax=Acrasis kona TaxID=1008807 RepID=A0AAW2YU24_9EUKA
MNYYRWTENTQYKLRVDSNSDTKICLGVQQQVREGAKPAHISFYVSKCDPKDENSVIYEINKAAENEKFVSDKEVSGSLMVEPNKNYIVIPCTFNADIEANFTLSATWRKDTYPDAKVHLSPILDVDKETITVTSSWSGERAGGSVNDLESWQKNPRFALKLTKDATVNILLCQTEKEQNKLSAVGFHIFEKNQKEPTFKHQSWNYFRIASCKIALKASTTYSIIPSTFYKNEEKPFILKIITQKGVVDSFKQEL